MSGAPDRSLPLLTSVPPRSQRPAVRPGSLVWFMGHEARLALRDWIRPGRGRRVLATSLALAVVMHAVGFGLALAVPSKAALAQPGAERGLMIGIMLALLSVLAMMVAQAMEAVSRAFYVRGDLELILSSPAPIARLFAVRMGAVTLTTLSLAGFLILPIVDMLALINDWRWLSAYGVLLALAAFSQTIALAATGLLFRLIGPKRARLIIQIVAAVIGAATVIGTQVPVILRAGTLSRLEVLRDPTLAAMLPAPDSLVWLPARAAHGDGAALLVLLAVCLGSLALTVALMAHRFGAMVVAAAGMVETAAPARLGVRFSPRLSPASVLRQMEWRLILRDPWLISQSLMQILYLIPPALLLWRNFGGSIGQLAVLVPVVVMASGQLAGGLAWLALSAEDAPELIATAPISAGYGLMAKVQAVLIAVAVIVAPVLFGMALAAPLLAGIGLLFALLASGTNTFVQYAFRTAARRSQFRQRQRASRLATLTETATSISWAAAAGLTAAGSLFAVAPIGTALVLILLSARRL